MRRNSMVLALSLMAAACGGPGSTTGNVDTKAVGIYATLGSNKVLVFAPDAVGNATPVRVIAGPHTGLSLPLGMAVDSLGQLYVANRLGASVTVYARGATGDATPIRTLTATGMGSPEALAIGPADDLFVSTCPGCGQSAGGQTAIFHFPTQGLQSDYQLGGPTNSQLTYPGSIALDGSKNLIVANAFGGKVLTFAPGASGDTLPIRSFSPGGNVQSVAFGNSSILLGMPGAGIQLYPASAGPGTPAASTIPPSATFQLQYPAGIFLDTSVTTPVLYVNDYGGTSIWIVKTQGTAPNLTALSTTSISGASTGLSAPLGLLVVTDGTQH